MLAQRTLAFSKEIGCLHPDVIVKFDQEAASKSLVEEIWKMRAMKGCGKWMVKNSQVGASASIGVVKKTIESVQGQTRIMKLAF